MPLANARTPLVCRTGSSMWPRMAASIKPMPLTSAKDNKPDQRFPTRPDMPSMPASCTAPSPTWASMRLAADRMTPASTRACDNSGQSHEASCFAKPSHPADVAATFRASAAATQNRCATNLGSTTSFAMSCKTNFSVTSNQDGSPAEVTVMIPASAPEPYSNSSRNAFVTLAFPASPPSGFTSAATMRASASFAFAQISFGPPFLAMALTSADKTPESAARRPRAVVGA
mmetsp:Transcript_86911/g.243528  ORF Transcript_86911/g.243528 Transcript_86911/m.243528 type:complete len:230 (-) Transcript_86911:679-1368(-)